MSAKKEILNQGKALCMIPEFMDNQEQVIWKYGEMFREIIDSHKDDGLEASAEDIIWIASQKLGKDLQLAE